MQTLCAEMAKKLITREFFPLKDGVLKEEVVSIGDEKGLSARLWTGQDLDSVICSHLKK